jgi:uncharacterized circularly permuted ATP-grasp superfamily protein/uncharacterized alpha-E superfamily protein
MPTATTPSLAYAPQAGRYDEAMADDGLLRPAWSRLVAALGPTNPVQFAERQRQADRLLDAEGAGHLVHRISLERTGLPETVSTSFRLDPLPFPIGQEEFATLAGAVTQRLRVLELVLADLDGPRQLVRDRILPAQTLYALRSYRPGGVQAGRRLITYAMDVARDADGRWGVVRDMTDSASGLGVSLLLRSVVARLLPDALRIAGVAPIHDHFVALRRALLACAPSDRRSPRCVLLTPGPAYRAYVEHSYLATQLGYHLVEGADLVMREGRLWLRALDGLEAVDVLFRRVGDDELDPLEARTTAGVGVPGVVWGCRRGGIGVANAPGTSVAQEPAVTRILDLAARRLIGEPLQLPLLGDVPLATTPIVGTAGPTFAAGQVVLRLHAVAGPDGIMVMPGATARLQQPTDNSDGGTRVAITTLKDVWVIGAQVSRRISVRVAAVPQVDLFTSLPKRAADSLFWLGRAAERAEFAARTAREVGGQLDRDPGLGVEPSGWADGALALLRAAQATPTTPPLAGVRSTDRLAAEIELTCGVVAAQIATIVQEAVLVREFMSTTTGRVLGRLAEVRDRLGAPAQHADDLDTVLVDLAALTGLATESTVRGPAWRFLDIGRRLERALAVLGAVEAGVGIAVEPFALQPLAEAVLASNESLVTYRRRYRSDVVLDAVIDLLVGDDTNPRALTYQLDRLREHMAALGWADGLALVDRSSIGALSPVDAAAANGRRIAVDALVLAARGPLLELGTAIVQRWFADPVNPTVMGGR